MAGGRDIRGSGGIRHLQRDDALALPPVAEQSGTANGPLVMSSFSGGRSSTCRRVSSRPASLRERARQRQPRAGGWREVDWTRQTLERKSLCSCPRSAAPRSRDSFPIVCRERHRGLGIATHAFANPFMEVVMVERAFEVLFVLAPAAPPATVMAGRSLLAWRRQQSARRRPGAQNQSHA